MCKFYKGLILCIAISILFTYLFSFSVVHAETQSPVTAQPPNKDVSHPKRLDAPTRRVLCLNSYHEGFKWSDDILDGINSGLVSHNFKIEFQTEYLDTQRVSDENYLEILYESYKYKFKSNKFDLIIASDDAAFQFLLKYGDNLFPDIPVVFCGVNDYKESMLQGHDLYTGIIRGYEISDTIDIALKLQPDIKKVYYLNDNTAAGQYIKEEFDKIIPDYQGKLQFVALTGRDLFDISKQLKSLPPDGIVLLLIYNKEATGRHLDYYEAATVISESSNLPVYSIWDFYLGNGIVGGKFSSGYHQGEKAAEMAVRILNGTAPKDISVNEVKISEYAFDFAQLRTLGINIEQLPVNSKIINLPHEAKKKVLIINSYNKGLKWTDDIENGIKEALSEKINTLDIFYEYIDANRNSDPISIQKSDDFLRNKYLNSSFDLIITTDEEAYDFINRYSRNLFKDTSIVFCGVNRIDFIDPRSHATGVLEAIDIEGTIELALSLYPGTERLVVINDTTPTGEAVKKNNFEVLNKYKSKMPFFRLLQDINMTDLIKQLETFEEGTIILLLSYSRDKSYNLFSYNETIKTISSYSKVPVFGVWDFYLGNGLLGGIITSGYEQGLRAGAMAFRILDGENPKNIPVESNSPNKVMFDYNVMERFGLEMSDIPDGATIVNLPYTFTDFFNENKKEIMKIIYGFSLLIIITLFIIVILLNKNVRIRKEGEERERNLAMTDALTGIPNRRAAYDNLKRMMAEVDRSGTALTVCYIDVDNMKHVNDNYGHKEGDELLKSFAGLLLNNIRGSDIACRLGGDEFMIVFHNTGLAKAKETCQRIHLNVSLFNQERKKPYDIKASCGFAEYTAEYDKSMEELLEEADNAMYKAKENNRKADVIQI